MNDHGLEQLCTSLLEKKIHWIYYSLLFLVSSRIFTHRTNSAILILLLELWRLSFPPIKKNLGERCIYIRKVIMNLWGKMHLYLQKKRISMVIQILARYKRLGTRKTGLSPPVFLYRPFHGGTSVVVPYCYLFLMSVFILWFSYYVSDIFCKF